MVLFYHSLGLANEILPLNHQLIKKKMDCPIIPFQSLSLNLKWSGTNHFSHWHYSFRFWSWLRWHQLVSFYLVSIPEFLDQKYPFCYNSHLWILVIFGTHFLKIFLVEAGEKMGLQITVLLADIIYVEVLQSTVPVFDSLGTDISTKF